MGARARAGRPWQAIHTAAEALCAGQTLVGAPEIPTFEDFAAEWTSGRIAKRHPDHVVAKETSDDDERLLKLYVNPVLRGLRLDQVTLTEADQVMAGLPEHLSPSSRRHVGQVVRRVLALALYPARHIKDNPIPRRVVAAWSERQGVQLPVATRGSRPDGDGEHAARSAALLWHSGARRDAAGRGCEASLARS
jgi:hypothetical protein